MTEYKFGVLLAQAFAFVAGWTLAQQQPRFATASVHPEQAWVKPLMFAELSAILGTAPLEASLGPRRYRGGRIIAPSPALSSQ